MSICLVLPVSASPSGPFILWDITGNLHQTFQILCVCVCVCSLHSDGGSQCEEGGPLLSDRHAHLSDVRAQRRRERRLRHRGPHCRGQCV